MSHSRALRLGRFALLTAAALPVCSASSQAGWRYHSATAAFERLAPRRIAEVEYVVARSAYLPPPIVFYSQPHLYGPMTFGAIRYNRPCTVSDGRFSYAVSCVTLADYGFIRSYNGW